MSAYVVSDNHIDALVGYAIVKKASFYFHPGRIDITKDNADKIGQTLLDENYRSVNHRYRNEIGKATRYKFKRLQVPVIDPVAILKAINCLDYQSYETDDWKTTEAWAILDGIK